MNLLNTLQTHFGHSQFRSGQLEVITALLNHQSALALFPTGAGKSLCYQLPALLLDGTALIVSPLIALMKDQVDSLRSKGIAAARLDSTLSAKQTQQLYADFLSGQLKLLYIAPERLSSDSFVDRLRRTKISLLAIDEAHCISEWGHNFRPEYLRLARLASELQIHPVLALTATATPEVARNICSAFSIAPQHHLQTSFHRKNLHLRITPCLPSDRLDLLTKRLANPKISPSIVYVTFQKTAELVATHLSNAGLPATPYHAGLSPEERHKIQDEFMRGSSSIIVATIAFGMGIDKSNIRSVIHFNLPKTLENYQQEIGRAGRDDLPAFCEILASADDAIPLENFTLGDTPAPEAILALVTRLLTSGESFDISRYDLSQETDIRPLVLETVITYLELSGLLRPTHSFYTTTQIQFLKTETQILAPLNDERKAFLSALFLSGHRTPKYLTLTLETSAEKLREPRERIVKALTWLEENGAITQKPAGLRHAFQLTAEAANTHPATVATAQSLLFAERESRDSLRLTQILDFTTQTGCITQRLLNYFGEPLPEESCHHCHFCKSRLPSSVIPLPATPIPPFTDDDDDIIQSLFFEEIPALSTPRQLTRFLCGLTSPATTRAKLTSRPEFARFSSHPFRTVLAQVHSCCTEAD